MKKLLCSLFTLLYLFSCEITDQREDLFAEPVPCHVESVFTDIGKISTNEQYGTLEISDIARSVNAEHFYISVLTFDSIIGWSGEDLGFHTGIGQGIIASEGAYCKESIPEVEHHIYNWAKERNENSKPLWGVKWNNTRTICYHFPYRLEGITSFSVSANKFFNGIEAGKDITECFVIAHFSPELIFSYDDYSTYSLEWNKTMTISEWLALRPLASPCMLLRLSEESQEAVEDIVFTITVKLINGKVLSSQTPTVNIE